MHLSCMHMRGHVAGFLCLTLAVHPHREPTAHSIHARCFRNSPARERTSEAEATEAAAHAELETKLAVLLAAPPERKPLLRDALCLLQQAGYSSLGMRCGSTCDLLRLEFVPSTHDDGDGFVHAAMFLIDNDFRCDRYAHRALNCAFAHRQTAGLPMWSASRRSVKGPSC